MSNLIGARLGGWRRAKGLTQAALAARTGLSQAAVSEIECGRRDVSLRTVFRMAVALDVTPGTLLDADPPRARLDRQEADAVARAVVTGARDLPPAQRRLADACAAAMRPTLEACGAPGAVRARRRGARALRAAEQRFGAEAVRNVLQRIDRHAAAGAR